jgi:hypothetical protein
MNGVTLFHPVNHPATDFRLGLQAWIMPLANSLLCWGGAVRRKALGFTRYRVARVSDDLS